MHSSLREEKKKGFVIIVWIRQCHPSRWRNLDGMVSKSNTISYLPANNLQANPCAGAM